MAANRKTRKAYTPRPALLRPMTFGISSDDTRALKLIPHAELVKLQAGHGGEETFHTIACRLNFGYVLADRNDFGMDLKPPMKAALDAIVGIRERHGRVGKWGASGDEQSVIGQALVYTDDMQDATTRREHRDALRIVLDQAAE